MGKKKKGSIDAALLKAMSKDFDSEKFYKIMQNAVTKVTVNNMAVQRDVMVSADHNFSVKLDDWEATNQEKSGRCWIFAGLNMLRPAAMKKMKLKKFEFSQNYILFYDKLEKANYFLETMIELVGRDPDDRTVSYLLKNPVNDGGQWNMLVNIIKKYGLVPKAAMPETESSSSTQILNEILTAKLRQATVLFKEMYSEGGSAKQLRVEKKKIMTVINRILRIHLGNPPDRFDWQWRDAKDKFHKNSNMTPKKFAEIYVKDKLDDYVCLVHDPRGTSPYGRTFTVEYLGNVYGGAIVKYFNIEIELMKKIAVKMLTDKQPVWFGCDVGKQMEGDAGVWDAELRDYGSIYETSLDMSKEERLLYGASCMTHAMLFTGVDLEKNKPRRWRVENSWGDKKADKGFYLMNDSWFNEHMFEIAARKKYLPAKLRKALKLKPVVLPAWDPMGSLAL